MGWNQQDVLSQAEQGEVGALPTGDTHQCRVLLN
jgi:hypothetical protein